MPTQRRERRSSRPEVALSLYFEQLREREELDAVALTTADGLYISGSGPVDLARLGAEGSATRGSAFEWERRTAHVRRFEHHGVPLVLTSCGRALFGDAHALSIGRILG